MQTRHQRCGHTSAAKIHERVVLQRPAKGSLAIGIDQEVAHARTEGIDRARIGPHNEAAPVAPHTRTLSTLQIEARFLRVDCRAHQLDRAAGTTAARPAGTANATGPANSTCRAEASSATISANRTLSRRAGLPGGTEIGRETVEISSTLSACHAIGPAGTKLGIHHADIAARDDLHGTAAGTADTADTAAAPIHTRTTGTADSAS